MRCSINGNLTKIKKLADKYNVSEITQYRDRESHILQHLDEKDDLLFVSSN
jgi:hypothetical protein